MNGSQALPQRVNRDKLPERPSSENTVDISKSGDGSARTIVPADLCVRCTAIAFDELFSTKVKNRMGKFIIELAASRSELEASVCSLCQLFASVAPTKAEPLFPWMGKRTAPLNLRAFSARRVFLGRDANKFVRDDVTLLGVVQIDDKDALSDDDDAYIKMDKWLSETGYLFPDPTEPDISRFGLRSIRPTSFDVEFAKNCIAYCREKHGTTCNESVAGVNATLCLRVIDCKTRRVIIAPPDCSYAALSYVWGASAPEPMKEGKTADTATLDGCPKIVSDGIEATLKIDFQYLWVDRYCIDQNDARDKHNQIRQMDIIYANARVTIIAATSLPENGLPGMAGVERSYQPCFDIGSHRIGRTLHDPMALVDRSKWATRGWTYQEGLLSKCRLIFTDEQVIFECNGMHCAESITLPLDAMHDNKKKTFKSSLPLGAFRSKTPGSDPYDIMNYISEFSKRELSFLTDRLNAMRGIFHIFETANWRVHHLMGVPIMPPCVSASQTLGKSKLYKGLLRSPEQGFLIGLTWVHSSPGGRIPEFPSWSWAGWSGELDPELMWKRTWETSLVLMNVWIKDGDNDKMRLLDFSLCSSTLQKLRDVSPQEPLGRLQFIEIETYAFSCSTVDLRKEDSERDYTPLPEQHYVEAAGKSDWNIYFPVSWDRELEEHELDGKALTGIFIGNPYGPGWSGNLAVIIVEEMDGYTERVAVGQDAGIRCKAWQGSWTRGTRTHDWEFFPPQLLPKWASENAEQRTIKVG
jgi:hypothetical protein